MNDLVREFFTDDEARALQDFNHPRNFSFYLISRRPAIKPPELDARGKLAHLRSQIDEDNRRAEQLEKERRERKTRLLTEKEDYRVKQEDTVADVRTRIRLRALQNTLLRGSYDEATWSIEYDRLWKLDSKTLLDERYLRPKAFLEKYSAWLDSSGIAYRFTKEYFRSELAAYEEGDEVTLAIVSASALIEGVSS